MVLLAAYVAVLTRAGRRRQVSVAQGHRLGLLSGDARGHEVDARVDDDHDGERDVEGTDRCIELVVERRADDARVPGLAFLLPTHQGRDTDERRRHPHAHDHGEHATRRALDAVLEGTGDDEVAIDTDHAQVEDGRRTQHDVQRSPRVAHRVPVNPLAADLVGDGERHDEESYEQVGDGQRHNQQVGRCPELADDRDGDTHEYIADDRADDYERTRDGDENGLP